MNREHRIGILLEGIAAAETADANYFHEPSHDGPGRFTIVWRGGAGILECYGAQAERLVRAVENKSSDEIRAILQEEIRAEGVSA